MPAAPTAPAVEDVLGPPPKAPHAPDVEDVLGPPPRPPHIGGRGKALSRVAPLRRAPAAPRVGHRVESADSRQAAQRPQPAPPPQKIVIEDKRAPAIIRDSAKASSEQLYRPARNLGGTQRMKSERAKAAHKAATAVRQKNAAQAAATASDPVEVPRDKPAARPSPQDEQGSFKRATIEERIQQVKESLAKSKALNEQQHASGEATE